jgi:hypothetical protein
MQRYNAGVISALLLATAGLFIWRAQAGQAVTLPAAPPQATAGPMGFADLAGPPSASEKTREEKRFARYDKDRNGAVGREEYLVARRKAFAKFDLDHDGKLSFDEYAIETETKFAAADKDRNGALTAPEFDLTRVVRKTKARVPTCKPTPRLPQPDEAEDS